MLTNHALITSLLLEAWFIDGAYAEAMFPSVLELLEGKSTPNLPTNYEKPIPSLLDADFHPVSFGPADNQEFVGFGSAPSGSTAVIPIRGAITKYDSLCNNGVESYMRWIEEAEQSPSISDLVLLIDSPGGQANSAFMLAERVANFQKPTLSYIDSGYGTSAAYLIGSAAKKMYVSTPVDMVGSIGAMWSMADYSGQLQGTKVWEVYSRLSTEKNAATRRLRANNDTSLIEDMLDENVTHFIEAVKTYRGSRLDATAGDPFKGATYTAAQALKMGLIDGIAPLPKALSLLRNEKITVPAAKTQLTTETTPTENNTDMSFKKKLIDWLSEQPEETTATDAVVETVLEAIPDTAVVDLTARMAALELQSAELINLRAENARLKSEKPAAAPTSVIVAKENVPTPVETVTETTSFLSETDEEAAKLRGLK